jgi:hypothetical protein
LPTLKLPHLHTAWALSGRPSQLLSFALLHTRALGAVFAAQALQIAPAVLTVQIWVPGEQMPERPVVHALEVPAAIAPSHRQLASALSALPLQSLSAALWQLRVLGPIAPVHAPQVAFAAHSCTPALQIPVPAWGGPQGREDPGEHAQPLSTVPSQSSSLLSQTSTVLLPVAPTHALYVPSLRQRFFPGLHAPTPGSAKVPSLQSTSLSVTTPTSVSSQSAVTLCTIGRTGSFDVQRTVSPSRSASRALNTQRFLTHAASAHEAGSDSGIFTSQSRSTRH